jgi:dipeptidase E
MPIVYPPTFNALELLPFNINPHYIDPDPSSRHMGETRETRIKEFLVFNSQPVIGLREGSWLRAKGPALTLGGDKTARVFQQGQDPIEQSPEEDLTWLIKASNL